MALPFPLVADASDELAERLLRIQRLADMLTRSQTDADLAMQIAKDILREATAAHALLRPADHRP